MTGESENSDRPRGIPLAAGVAEEQAVEVLVGERARSPGRLVRRSAIRTRGARHVAGYAGARAGAA